MRTWVAIVWMTAVLGVASGCSDNDDDGPTPATPTSVPTATQTSPPATPTTAFTATQPPAPTQTSTPVPTSTSTQVPTHTSTPLPTHTATPVPTDTATPEPTSTDTPLPTSTPTITDTPTVTATPTITSTPTATPTLGPPIAGIAEAFADFPVGAPLGGFTSRCRCFGGAGRYDGRTTAYQNQFSPSLGVQTQPKIVALWLENGPQSFVLMKTDAIYVFEGLVTAVERTLSEATGRDMRGKVVITANHTHNAPANFDMGITWYLGGDKFNREVFERYIASLTNVALDAWNRREPAAIGIGQRQNWDPQDRVYSDRRESNNQHVFFDDIPAGPYKDPNLTVLRVDTAAGVPLGMFFAFGMHGTIAGDDNQLWSVDSGGHVEAAVEERFDHPVVVGYMQHGGGDASPRGVDDNFARMESVGELAADAIYDLWNETPTSSATIDIESLTRSIDTHRDLLQVHRDQGVLQYTAFDPSADYLADDIVYDEQGRIRTPIDEFNTQYGGAFCGEENPPLPITIVGSQAYPYNSCAEVGTLSEFIQRFFNLPAIQKPLPESLLAKTSAARLGPLPILQPNGETVVDDVLFGFFPGETTATYTEQFRRRAAAELGMQHIFPVGYAQDHQGYLLIPEDWLLGGYEASINIWGPLQGEHIMEGLLAAAGEILTTPEIEELDPNSLLGDPVYPAAPLPTTAPDLTPDAGTALSAVPEKFIIPLSGITAAVAPPSQVRRVQDIVQFMWEGGDPGVDLPLVYVEQRQEDGSWVKLQTAAGREISTPMYDIIVSTTPNPLKVTEVQHHNWWAAWQPVAHSGARSGLPAGTYRLLVQGRKYAGGAVTWPWPSQPYELTSPEFELVPAELAVGLAGTTVTASLDVAASGYRLVDLEGSSRGRNPVRGATVRAVFAEGASVVNTTNERIVDRRTAWDIDPADLVGATAIEVEDAFGNRGTFSLQ